MGRNGILTLLSACITLCLLASACGPEDQVETPDFNSENAYDLLKKQVAFGPRVPGTQAHKNTASWLVESLEQYSEHVSLQPFSGVIDGREFDMNNIIASFYPEKTERVLLCAHWDCRHTADHDPDPANHDKPVPGANDSASGVAVLLEMARLISANEPPVGIDIALFDGEDGGKEHDSASWLLGSRHFAQAMPDGYRPKYAILLDMIGDKDLRLSPDVNSRYSAGFLWDKVLEISTVLNIAISGEEIGILDDHIPLIERGIPAIDLIDFDYPYWHTVEDTPDKCSAESLGKIGRLVLTIVYGE